MNELDILRCYIASNVIQREESIIWGVDCDIDFNFNILKALRCLALKELEDVDDCPLIDPYDCECDEIIAAISQTDIYKCVVAQECESEKIFICAITLVDPTTNTEPCATISIRDVTN